LEKLRLLFIKRKTEPTTIRVSKKYEPAQFFIGTAFSQLQHSQYPNAPSVVSESSVGREEKQRKKHKCTHTL
jgi:hypothetical protein